ncbi:hypothetical protein N7520_006222 [Penicillium odoratum]|uniref:uncharacterized protein n=1 Tax=Penicillium odoratum TaxID=1167516 RepID=UPI002547F358|nr:uncharacterized protein N7520_006222 [Penicillium odoratum]KAJ5759066.1 hypothetical protein N7520_006222 [Penicillium odoratum]
MTPAISIDHNLPSVVPESNETPAAFAPTNDLFSLAGRTVAITGGGRGLGMTLTTAVLEVGGDVACLDLLPEPSAQEWIVVQKLAKAKGLQATYNKCDITDEEATKGLLGKIAADGTARNMPLRGLITCAGVQQMVPALDYPIDGYRKMLDVNVLGTFIPAKHFSRILVEEKAPSSIVMIASMSGQIANRAAVHQMCRSVAQEWGQHNIRVNTLSARYIRTAMTDALLKEKPEVEETWMRGALLGRLGAPEDFKGPTIYMLTDASAWMTGADLRVDGGHCASA